MLKRDDDDDFLAFPYFLSIKLHHNLLLWSLSLQNFKNHIYPNGIWVWMVTLTFARLSEPQFWTKSTVLKRNIIIFPTSRGTRITLRARTIAATGSTDIMASRPFSLKILFTMFPPFVIFTQHIVYLKERSKSTGFQLF